jgi:hypothetical protein
MLVHTINFDMSNTTNKIEGEFNFEHTIKDVVFFTRVHGIQVIRHVLIGSKS